MLDSLLSTQQLQVICALSSGASMTNAAAESGIHRNTITNWRRSDLHFQEALAHAHYDRALLYREKIEALVPLAIHILRELLVDPQTPATVRLKAALTILQTAATPPEPKIPCSEMHKPAQPEPKAEPQPENALDPIRVNRRSFAANTPNPSPAPAPAQRDNSTAACTKLHNQPQPDPKCR